MRQFFPGDWVRLKPKDKRCLYPLLWKLVAEVKRESPLVVEESIWDEKLYREYIRVRWPTGSMSGLLYADIFHKVRE